jgi:DASS family divalent anion:Na+ symporter
MEKLRKYKPWFLVLFPLLIGGTMALISPPEGVTRQAWNLGAIFLTTVLAIILKPLPMSAIALFGLTVAMITGTLSFDQAFSGFSNDIVWLVVFSFFVARGFILTKLGTRLAYKIMSLFGKNSLGLGYGLVATDLILAPTLPSVTARAGGIVFPILRALVDVFTGKSHDPRMGAFLTQCAFQGSAITSAMFLTSMAGNPLIAKLALDQGITLTWAGWALAAIVPGLISLAVVPYLIFRLAPPTIRQTPHAKEMARERLAEMGPMRSKEWIMVAIFILLIVLWILGPTLNLKPTIPALLGLVIMLCTGILHWKDVLEEQGAWDAFIWFSVLVTLATFLNKFGLMQWFSDFVVSHVSDLPWVIGFIFICLIYFYTHYFFASNIAHISAMYAPLFIVSIALGTPPELAALSLGFFSSLFGGLTHYGSGPAPIFFGSGYVEIREWWKIGFMTSVANIVIWLVIGGLWWKVLGLW